MTKQWIIPALAAFLIVGCTTTATVVSETPAVAPPTLAPALDGQEAPSQEPSPAASPAKTLEEPTQAPVATIRPALEATNPDSVDLASGPTLVEFFAFW